MAKTAPQRRPLHFTSIDRALAEAQRLAGVERESRLERTGNWTLGQALGHLATWANFPFDGYPVEVHPPLPVRMILRLLRGRILKHGLTPGVRLRNIPGGTLGVDAIDAEEGLQRMH